MCRGEKLAVARYAPEALALQRDFDFVIDSSFLRSDFVICKKCPFVTANGAVCGEAIWETGSAQ
jgi:hypothetical protein